MQLKAKNSIAKTRNIYFGATVLLLGLCFNTVTLASDAEIQLATYAENSMVATEKQYLDAEDEIGSTDVSEFDNRIGAFSMEDGAMMGAYGDGEYVD